MNETGTQVEKRLEPTGKIPTLQLLDLTIDDTRLLKYINALEKTADEHWNKKDGMNLKNRRKQNLKYLFGKQLIGRDLKPYESEFLDNVIYEYEAMLKSLAVSRLPDIIVKAGGADRSEEKILTAELLSKANENKMLDKKFKKALGILFKHLPAYLISCYKYRWDNAKGKIGDIVEEVINPESIVLDPTALSSDPDEQTFIIHYVEKTGKEWAMLFPKKETDIIEHIKKLYPELAGSDAEDWLLAQKVKVAEIWFDWFDKAEDFDVENPNFDFMSGVAWKMGDALLLGKSKNPNWDYEGHDSVTLNGKPITPDVMEQIIMTGQQPQGFEIKKVFNNYFEFPRKPFIFMSFDQFMRSAIDETSRIEQTIPLQKSLDEVERQVDYMDKHHKGKHIWSSESGMTKKDLKKLDMDNPNNDIIVKGIPSNVHSYIQPVMPDQALYIHIRERRDRMFAKVGTHGATRGELQSDVATSNQISREADFTRSDDLVDETILHVTTEIAKARLHMMKLRYTPAHWKKLAGLEEGKYLELRLDNDSLDDGMEVVVKASTTDKLRAERNAQAMAELGYIEPISFFKDMNIPNPEERAEMLFLKESNPNLYYQKYILKKDISALANQVVDMSQPQVTPSAPVTGMPTEATVPTATQTSAVPNQVQGSPRGLVGRAMGGLRKMMGL